MLNIDGDPEKIFNLVRRVRAEQAVEQIWEDCKKSGTDTLTFSEISDEIHAAKKSW